LPESPLRKAVFLDRDGTIIEDTVFSVDPARIRELPGALDGLRRLRRAGYLLVVITNQSGVARGFFGEDALRAFHDRLREWFAARGVELAAIYYCPHYPKGALPEYARDCACRKPMPGMILQAASDLQVDRARSWMVGDRDCDIGVGRAAGCRTVRIGTTPPGETTPDYEAANVAEAAERILAAEG